MRYRQLGDSGLTVSVVGLGTNQFRTKMNDAAVRDTVSAALDAGITLFDTADIYGNRGGSESLLGEVLKGRRDDVVLATKFGMDMRGANGEDHGARGSRRYIRRAVEASLRRLQTDHVDLYQYHQPDGVTPVHETLGALDELVREGKVRYIGSSNFAAWQVADAEWTSRTEHLSRFISGQNRYSLLERDAETELTPACRRYGVGILPFFPLAMGLLTGKYRRGQPAPPGSRLAGRDSAFTDEVFDRVEALEEFARRRGLDLLDVAIGGLAAQPQVGSVIAGATKPEQVRANARAGDWIPSPEDLDELNRIGRDARSG
jgi:aryl-alcohol dehydrogenase-like predicted oxidoreductase